MKNLPISIQSKKRSYPIYFGLDLDMLISGSISTVDSAQLFVVTDQNVYRLYKDTMLKILAQTGKEFLIHIIPPGEDSKSLKTISDIVTACLSFELDRTGTIIAWGGGVVGDVAGLAASLYKRGVRYYQIPTTLLSQVDSSIGGKVAVNFKGLKNQIGAFHQPSGVFVDGNYLKTLDSKQYKSGMGEVIKSALILDEDLFYFIETEKDRILSRETDILSNIVYQCCGLKKKVVEEDETDEGIRGILNFGHTIGHAIEYALSESDITHGEAVALGILIEARISYLSKMLSQADLLRIESILEGYGFMDHQYHLSVEKIVEGIHHDKKASGQSQRFVFLKGMVRPELGLIGLDELEKKVKKLIPIIYERHLQDYSK